MPRLERMLLEKAEEEERLKLERQAKALKEAIEADIPAPIPDEFPDHPLYRPLDACPAPARRGPIQSIDAGYGDHGMFVTHPKDDAKIKGGNGKEMTIGGDTPWSDMRDNTSAEFLHNPPAALVKPKIEGWEVAHKAETGKPYSRGCVPPVTKNRVSIALPIRPLTAAGSRQGQRRVNTNPTGTSSSSWSSSSQPHRPVSALERSHASEAGARPLSAAAGPANTRLKPRLQHLLRGTTPLDKACKGLNDRNQSVPGEYAISSRAMVHSGLVRPLSAQSTVGASGKLNRVLQGWSAPQVKTLVPRPQSSAETETAGQDWVRSRPTHSGVGQPRIHSWGRTRMGRAPSQYSWQTGFLTQGRPFRYFGHSQAHVVYV